MADKQQSTGKTRRGLLVDALALFGGATIGAGVASDEFRKLSFEKLRQGLETTEAEDLLGVRVRAATPSDEDYGQYRGGNKRQGVFNSTLSATGKQGEQTYHSDKNLIQAPVTDGQGNVMSQTPETMYGVNLDTEETFSAPALGETQIISDGEHAYTADGTDLIKTKIPEGTIIERKTDVLGSVANDTAPFTKDGEKAYVRFSDGILEVDLDSMDTKEHIIGPKSVGPNTYESLLPQQTGSGKIILWVLR